MHKRINVCNSRYFWLTQNTWRRLLKGVILLWALELVMPCFPIHLCSLSAHCTPTSASPAVLPDLSHMHPSPPFLLPLPSSLLISFSFHLQRRQNALLPGWSGGSTAAQTTSLTSIKLSSFMVRMKETVAPSISAKISQLVQKIGQVVKEIDIQCQSHKFLRQPG